MVVFHDILRKETHDFSRWEELRQAFLFVKLIFFANIQKFHKKLDFLGANAYLYSEHT